MTVALPDENLDDLLLNLPTPQLTYMMRSLTEAAETRLLLAEWTSPDQIWGQLADAARSVDEKRKRATKLVRQFAGAVVRAPAELRTRLLLAVGASEDPYAYWALRAGLTSEQQTFGLLPPPALAVDAECRDARTPLTAAIEGGDFQTAAYLLDHGADPNCADGNELTPVMAAASYGAEEGCVPPQEAVLPVLRRLLTHCEDIDRDDPQGTALAKAVRCGFADAARLLLAAGADPALGPVGFRAVDHVAQVAGHPDLVERLTAPPPGVPTAAESRPMRRSYFLTDTDNHTDVCETVLGGALSHPYRAGLRDVLACWRPNPEVWRRPAVAVSEAAAAVAGAVSVDADLQQLFAWAPVAERAALVYTQRNDDADRPGAAHELVEAWLFHQAALRDPQYGADAWPVPQLAREAWAAQRTVLQQAVAGGCPAAYVPLLVAAGEDVGARDAQGATALHWAAAVLVPDDVGHGFAAQALLEAGAELEACDHRGRTPTNVAGKQRNWPVVRTLVNAGALVSEERWRVVVQMARHLGWPEVDEWKCCRAAQGLDGVLAGPAVGSVAGRARM